MVEAARYLKRFTLEMGGKRPRIVLKDADLHYALDAAAFGIFLQQSQVCIGNSKIIVEVPFFESFCDRFIANARKVRVGDPCDPTTVIGPLRDTVETGAHVLAGAVMTDASMNRP